MLLLAFTTLHIDTDNLNSLLLFDMFFCTINSSAERYVIRCLSMMPYTKTFVPLYLESKLHIRAQLNFGVLPLCASHASIVTLFYQKDGDH